VQLFGKRRSSEIRQGASEEKPGKVKRQIPEKRNKKNVTEKGKEQGRGANHLTFISHRSSTIYLGGVEDEKTNATNA